MQWKKDLELLINQTKALVAPSAEAPLREFIETASIEPQAAAINPAEKFDAPDAPSEPLRLTPALAPMQWKATSRDEIKARVANFKANQEKFNRDREDYYLQTLARTRTPLENARKAAEKRLKD
jgi:hypothetical protein